MTHDPAVAPLTIVADRDAAGAHLLRLAGQIDLSSVPALHSAVDEVLRARPTTVRFEMSEVAFMDSSGIAVLLEVAGCVAVVELVSPSTAVRRVVELSGLASILPVAL